MAGPAPSNESILRRSIRFTFGITLVFSLTQLIGWPLAFIAPVFALGLLIEAVPISVRSALSIFTSAIVALLCGYCITLFALPYPAILALAGCLMIYLFFIYILTSGGHLLSIVCVLISFTVIPVVVKLLPELAIIAGLGIVISLFVAILCAWFAFLVLPAPAAPPDPHHHDGMDPSEAESLARKMTLVAAPLFVCFLLFGWTSILVLVYGTLIATALSSDEGIKMGWKFVAANLLIGGLGMYIFYESLVAIPNIVFMVSLSVMFLFIGGSQIFNESPTSPLWFSGTIGFLLLIGAALPSDKVLPSAKIIDRVVQIGIASAYVIFAYRVIDLFKKPLVSSEKR